MKKFTSEQDLIIDISKNVMNLDNYIPKSLLIENIDWDLFYESIIQHKIFQISYKSINEYIPKQYKVKYDIKHKELVDRVDDSIKGIEDICALADMNNIEIIIIKGIVLSKLIYNDIYLREYGDIDILLRENDIMEFRQLLNSIGFFNTYMNSTNKFQLREPSPTKLGVFHEYVFSKKVRNLYIFAELKTYTSAIRKKFINDFLSETQCIKIDNCNILTNNLIYTFLHLCANIYGNSERRFNIRDNIIIRDYIDIYVFINKYQNELHWPTLQQLANKYNILHEIYCTFNNLNSIYHGFLSDELIQLFNPKNATYKFDGTEKGSVVNWSSDFLYRLFNIDERVKEYEYLYYLRGYSNSNTNYNYPIILDKYDNNSVNNLDNYLEMICTEDSGLSFKYNLLYDSDGINLLLYLTKAKYEEFNNIRVDFNFFYNPKKCRDYVKVVKIYKNNNKVYCEYANSISDVNDIIYTDNGIILRFNMNFDYIGEDLNEMKNRLCYNIYVFEVIYNDTDPILIGVKYANPGDPEETSNLGVLQLAPNNQILK